MTRLSIAPLRTADGPIVAAAEPGDEVSDAGVDSGEVRAQPGALRRPPAGGAS